MLRALLPGVLELERTLHHAARLVLLAALVLREEGVEWVARRIQVTSAVRGECQGTYVVEPEQVAGVTTKALPFRRPVPPESAPDPVLRPLEVAAIVPCRATPRPAGGRAEAYVRDGRGRGVAGAGAGRRLEVVDVAVTARGFRPIAWARRSARCGVESRAAPRGGGFRRSSGSRSRRCPTRPGRTRGGVGGSPRRW